MAEITEGILRLNGFVLFKFDNENNIACYIKNIDTFHHVAIFHNGELVVFYKVKGTREDAENFLEKCYKNYLNEITTKVKNFVNGKFH